MKITSICLILASAFAFPFGLLAQKASDAKRNAIANELKAAVKAGKLSKEDAKAKWAAIKEGLNADFITGVDGSTKPIVDVIKELLLDLEGIAEELGSVNRLKDVTNILNATPVVDYMREIHKQTSLVELVKELQKKLLDSLSDDN